MKTTRRKTAIRSYCPRSAAAIDGKLENLKAHVLDVRCRRSDQEKAICKNSVATIVSKERLRKTDKVVGDDSETIASASGPISLAGSPTNSRVTPTRQLTHTDITRFTNKPLSLDLQSKLSWDW